MLRVRGAREHNLRSVDLDLPHGLLVGFSGVSGSGKSSLVFDTIHREGQRRFLECLSPFARQFLGPLERPALDSIEGLGPTVAVDQRGLGRSPRSTVGTVTEVHDYLRLLFSRLGTPHCPSCGREVVPQSPERIVDRILEAAAGRPSVLLAPVVRDRRGEHRGEMARLQRLGYVRARVDGALVRLDEPPALEKHKRHTIEVVLDRLTPAPEKRGRLREAVGAGLAAGNGALVLATPEGDQVFSSSRSCPACGVDLPEFEPRLFSFNSDHGACPRCEGTGSLDPESRPRLERGGAEEEEIEEPTPRTPPPCPECGGSRLNATARGTTFHGKGIAELCRIPLAEAARFFAGLDLGPREAAVGRDLFRELSARLAFLEEVGVGYVALERPIATLSAGEAQRVRLGSQLGAALCGVVYVLDEPTVGLHPRDVGRLLGSLRRLRDGGNTVLVVEHDEATLRACDLLVDLGPGAGGEGGRVVAFGTPAQVAREPGSPTGALLRGEGPEAIPPARRRPRGLLRVRGARGNNLKGIDVAFPLGCLVAVTGVSGSGKSTLVEGTLARALRGRLHGAAEAPEPHGGIEGFEGLSAVVELRAAPLGRTPRSNPATWTGLFDRVRALYAALPEARLRGFGPGRFSFNVRGGRCEACFGAGVRELRLDFLAPVTAPCPECEGSRFNAETLAVRRRGRSIADVLDMTVEEARAFFADHPRIRALLDALGEVGLGYLRVGQPSPHLSGGEAQRVRLAGALARRAPGRTLFLLDEPTTGLHARDVGTLLAALRRLVDSGHTVVVVEHHPDLVACADWVIDLGPGSGAEGGEIVAEGTPEEVAARPGATGAVLAALLSGRKAPPPSRAGPPRAGGAPDRIEVLGARANNLRDLSVAIPRGRLVAVTGPSGSGKTSLALDVVFAEGRRRFVESLSTYARRFLGRLERASVDRIEGLGPSIAVEGSGPSGGPRSTVATATQIHDALRVLYARAGSPQCPECGEALASAPPSSVAALAAREFAGRRGYVLAPLAPPLEDGGLRVLLARLRREGFARLLVDGRERRIEEMGSGPFRRLELVVDRVEFAPSTRARIAEAAEQAAAFGNGTVVLALAGDPQRRTFSTNGACPRCGFRLQEPLSPRHFSFNLVAGACPGCRGVGERSRCDPARVVVAPQEPFLLGALHPSVERLLRREDGLYAAVARTAARRNGIDLSLPFGDLTERARELLLRGTGERRYAVDVDREGRRGAQPARLRAAWPGLIGLVEGRAKGASGDLAPLLSDVPCEECGGERLRREARAVRLGDRTLPGLLGLTVAEALEFLEALALPEPGATCLREVEGDLRGRLEALEAVGLGYLTLDRSTASLSGGEARRVRLASMLGTALVGVVYVFDEPTVGLHPCDVEPLLEALRRLRDEGNTVIVVEHDEAVVRAADWVIDLGPGAGAEGGRVVAEGPPAALEARGVSATGRMLRGEIPLPAPAAERAPPRGILRLVGARARNLRGVSLEVPLGRLSAVCGPSGAGKSALVFESLLPALAQAGVPGAGRLGGSRPFDALHGASLLDRVVVLGSAPIGRTPLSNPATCTGIFEEIRGLFARAPEARARGFGPGRFSPFAAGGRCEACQGKGATRVPMEFLADVWLPCEECGGRRFDEATLAVRLQGRTIAEVLDLDVAAARVFFEHAPAIRAVLDALDFLGLGYLRLGQSATTLSGGESQRVRLAAVLAGTVARPAQGEEVETGEVPGAPGEGGRRLFLLDEPTVGLHLLDVAPLLAGLRRLVEAGDTVLLVEHHPEVLARADHLIEVGPGAGREGGRVVFAGTPSAIRGEPSSVTGRVLRARAGEGAAAGVE